MIMNNIKYILALFIAMSLVASCDIDEQANPNGSSIEGFQLDASKSEMQTLVTGMESLLREEINFYYDVTSIVGREYYFFTGSDPRYTGEVLGKGDATLDNAGFYGNRPYFGRYKTIRNANVLLDAIANSTQLTAAEASGLNGFAKTIQAYEYHLALMLQGDNGIRIDVSDIENLGPFVSYSDALAAIQSLLDEGISDLNAAGDAFGFNLSSGFSGFDTPSTFAQFNRGIAARLALYQGNASDAVAKLGASFMDLAGDLNTGPGRFYSTAGGDKGNTIFRVPDQADAIVAHPTFVSDMIDGDSRSSKVLERSAPITLDDLSGTHDVWVYKSLNDHVPYMRNEELILIYAEANVSSNSGEAVNAINIIRAVAGISDYAGATDAASLMNEILFQRRYSLFGEGHRWVDMRRLGRLNELPLDRAGDDVWPNMPVPVTEIGG
ncbi:MAG: hypothetical protein ACI9FN_003097 [Saprospiraceae bacterium]|jgi:hypothetical protein